MTTRNASLCASLRERVERADKFPPGWTDEHPSPDETRALLNKVDALTAALYRVLDWPLPEGDVETYALPGWLAKLAHDALGDDPKERPYG